MTKIALQDALNSLLVGLAEGEDLSEVLPDDVRGDFDGVDAFEDGEGATIVQLPETSGGKRFRIVVEEIR
jgi:hypothetical protein